MVVRSEACLQGGNFKDNSFNAFQAFTTGGLPPQIINSEIFMLTKNQEDLFNLNRKLSGDVGSLRKDVKDLMGVIARDHQQAYEKDISRKKVGDGTRPDKNLEPDMARSYLERLKDAKKGGS
jgi:hypothetical protein